MNNAQTTYLQLWFDTIRSVKESEILLRLENQIHTTRAQLITNFCYDLLRGSEENYFYFILLTYFIKTLDLSLVTLMGPCVR